jgi:hypothetical protein
MLQSVAAAGAVELHALTTSEGPRGEERPEGVPEPAGAVRAQLHDERALRDVAQAQAQLAPVTDPRGAVRRVAVTERYLAAGGEAERVAHRQAPA